MGDVKKFKNWYKERCGHPLAVNLGMKAVIELEKESAELCEAIKFLTSEDELRDLDKDSKHWKLIDKLLNK